jgi:hypothetical protein
VVKWNVNFLLTRLDGRDLLCSKPLAKLPSPSGLPCMNLPGMIGLFRPRALWRVQRRCSVMVNVLKLHVQRSFAIGAVRRSLLLVSHAPEEGRQQKIGFNSPHEWRPLWAVHDTA